MELLAPQYSSYKFQSLRKLPSTFSTRTGWGLYSVVAYAAKSFVCHRIDIDSIKPKANVLRFVVLPFLYTTSLVLLTQERLANLYLDADMVIVDGNNLVINAENIPALPVIQESPILNQNWNTIYCNIKVPKEHTLLVALTQRQTLNAFAHLYSSEFSRGNKGVNATGKGKNTTLNIIATTQSRILDETTFYIEGYDILYRIVTTIATLESGILVVEAFDLDWYSDVRIRSIESGVLVVEGYDVNYSAISSIRALETAVFTIEPYDATWRLESRAVAIESTVLVIEPMELDWAVYSRAAFLEDTSLAIQGFDVTYFAFGIPLRFDANYPTVKVNTLISLLPYAGFPFTYTWSTTSGLTSQTQSPLNLNPGQVWGISFDRVNPTASTEMITFNTSLNGVPYSRTVTLNLVTQGPDFQLSSPDFSSGEVLQLPFTSTQTSKAITIISNGLWATAVTFQHSSNLGSSTPGVNLVPSSTASVLQGSPAVMTLTVLSEDPINEIVTATGIGPDGTSLSQLFNVTTPGVFLFSKVVTTQNGIRSWTVTNNSKFSVNWLKQNISSYTRFDGDSIKSTTNGHSLSATSGTLTPGQSITLTAPSYYIGAPYYFKENITLTFSAVDMPGSGSRIIEFFSSGVV